MTVFDELKARGLLAPVSYTHLVAQSVCDTGSQCHYIFQCTAQLNSQYIGAGIDLSLIHI